MAFFILQILAFMKNASKFNFDWNEFDPSRPFVGKKEGKEEGSIECRSEWESLETGITSREMKI